MSRALQGFQRVALGFTWAVAVSRGLETPGLQDEKGFLRFLNRLWRGPQDPEA